MHEKRAWTVCRFNGEGTWQEGRGGAFECVCVCGGASTIRIFSNFANAIGHNMLDKNHLGEISLKILFGPNVSLYFRIGSKDFFQTLQHDRPQ